MKKMLNHKLTFIKFHSFDVDKIGEFTKALEKDGFKNLSGHTDIYNFVSEKLKGSKAEREFEANGYHFMLVLIDYRYRETRRSFCYYFGPKNLRIIRAKFAMNTFDFNTSIYYESLDEFFGL
jgi:hypothetical protein